LRILELKATIMVLSDINITPAAGVIRIPKLYTWYQVTIPVAAIKDIAGNNLLVTYTFKFKTGTLKIIIFSFF